jgi:hypothetical protein
MFATRGCRAPAELGHGSRAAPESRVATCNGGVSGGVDGDRGEQPVVEPVLSSGTAGRRAPRRGRTSRCPSVRSSQINLSRSRWSLSAPCGRGGVGRLQRAAAWRACESGSRRYRRGSPGCLRRRRSRVPLTRGRPRRWSGGRVAGGGPTAGLMTSAVSGIDRRARQFAVGRPKSQRCSGWVMNGERCAQPVLTGVLQRGGRVGRGKPLKSRHRLLAAGDALIPSRACGTRSTDDVGEGSIAALGSGENGGTDLTGSLAHSHSPRVAPVVMPDRRRGDRLHHPPSSASALPAEAHHERLLEPRCGDLREQRRLDTARGEFLRDAVVGRP